MLNITKKTTLKGLLEMLYRNQKENRIVNIYRLGLFLLFWIKQYGYL
jgi:hypothetical protein